LLRLTRPSGPSISFNWTRTGNPASANNLSIGGDMHLHHTNTTGEPLSKHSCKKTRPPLCSSGQGSWLQIQRFGFDSQRYHIFRGVVGLKRGPHTLVSLIDHLCCLAVKVPAYRSRGPGSIPDATRFSEKWVCNGVHSAS
jgi:hypothetical protein